MDANDIGTGLLEIKLAEPDDFLKIKETLTRIGIASFKNKTLFQSCHILHKQGRYFIVHFKELFILDGKTAEISEEDIQRRNMITKLLCEWNLCTPIGFDPLNLDVGMVFNRTKILKHSERDQWTLSSKHNLGRKQAASLL